MPAKKAPAPSAPTPPVLREDINHPPALVWFANENNQLFVKELLQDPRFTALCFYVAAYAEVTDDQLTGNPVPDAVVVRQAAFAAGLRAFPRRLITMLAATTRRVATEVMPYEHIQPTPQ